MKSINNFFKSYTLELLLISALIIIVGFLEYKVLYPHLLYGFGDVDWLFLNRYKNLPPFSLNQIIGEWQASGVYAYQTYYIGIQSIFFGIDYWKFQLATNIFKFLSTISLFPVLLFITKNKTISFVACIIYGIAYPSIGALYIVVTSGIYFAIFILNIFLLIYFYTISQIKSSKWWFPIMAILYYLALFFSTERLYPLIPLLFLAEIFILWRKNFPKTEIRRTITRILIILAPLIIAAIYRPYAQNNVQFLNNTWLLIEKIESGNWHLLLIPFTVLGSLFIPRDDWRYFGIVDVTSFERFHNYYLFSPFLLFAIVTIIIAFSVSKKPLIFIITTLIPTYFMGTLTYFLATRALSAPESLRMHYDHNIYLPPTLFGEFILSLSFSFLIEWIKGNFKNLTVFAMFFAPFMAFFFIFCTWLPSEPGLVFSNVHRYLTIPAIGSSLFISGFIWLLFNKTRQIKFLKYFSFLFFLLIFPVLVMNARVLSDYFKSELDFTGMRASDHVRMKGKFVSFLPEGFNAKDPSIFFVDSLGDSQNGYFHETTILAGFDFWMLFRNKPEPDKGFTPVLVRHDFFCPENDCVEKIKELVTEQNGQKGIFYAKTFYPEDRVFFYKLQNRDVFFQPDFKQKIGLK